MTDFRKKPDYDHKPDHHPKPKDFDLRVEDGTANEGDKVYFKIKIDGKADHDIKVFYKTEDGTAKAGQDYKGEYGWATIKKGTDHVVVDVKTIEDKKIEGNEYFKLKVWDFDKNVHVKDGEAKGTIIDDDFKKDLKLSIDDAYAKEGDKLVFKVKLDHKADENIKVFYKTEDGTAKAGQDYKGEHDSVVIKKGDDHAYITVKSIDDKKVEGNEYFKVKIWENEKNVHVADGEAKGTIIDNDFKKDLKLSIDDAHAKEGDKLVFKVKLDHKADENIKVFYKTEDGTAKAGQDYKGEYDSVVIKKGYDHAYITVKSIDDKKVEGNEYFKVKIWEHEKDVFVVDGDAKGTIFDNDHGYKPHHGDWWH